MNTSDHPRRYHSSRSATIALFSSVVLVISGTIAATPGAADANQVRIWLTEGAADSSLRLTEQMPLTWSATPIGENDDIDATINVDPNERFQEMTGFGASFTDSASSNVDRLNPAARNALMTDLFDREDGIGLSFLRQPLGASDYVDPAGSEGNPFYTYQDTPGSAVNISRDQRSIDLVKQAQQINDEITVMGSPWSPPAWMRAQNSLLGTNWENYLANAQYANYLVDVVKAYRDAGVTIDLMNVQNEPLHNPGYPGLILPASDRARAAMGIDANSTNHIDVVRSLSPKLIAANLPTQILVYGHNWDIPDQGWDDASWSDPVSDNPAYPVEVLAADVNGTQIADLPNVAGTALHCYQGLAGAGAKPGNSTLLHERFPTSGVYFTECSGVDTFDNDTGEETTFPDTMSYHSRNYIFPTLRNWSQSLVFWNMALDENNGPYPAGYGICGNCSSIVTVNSGQDSAYRKNVGYYLLGHFSKFVRPGAVRIGSTDTSSDGVHNVAFQNPDGTFAAVLYAEVGQESRKAAVQTTNGHITVTIPGNSMATITWGVPDETPGGGGTTPPVTPAPQPPVTPPTKSAKKIKVRTKAKIVRNAKPRKAVKRTTVKAVLRVKAGKYQPKTAKAKYQWLRNGKKIKKAKKVRYRVTKKDRGKKLRVRVTVTAKGFKKTSYQTKVVRVR
ncbi:glucosylceramidase [Micrococcales bacterium KH10]|nr:glucosylceramidase [Micrococcales bacterium KH10]